MRMSLGLAVEEAREAAARHDVAALTAHNPLAARRPPPLRTTPIPRLNNVVSMATKKCSQLHEIIVESIKCHSGDFGTRTTWLNHRRGYFHYLFRLIYKVYINVNGFNPK